jgi:mRNA interferase MazF
MLNLKLLKMTQKLRFGQIWLANLNPQSGTEPGKTRPVLVIQAQPLLDVNHPSTLIIPCTTNLIEGAEPLRIRLKAMENLEKDFDILIDQLRAIDNDRLIKGPLAHCNAHFMKKVQRAILDVIDCKIEDLY